LFALLGGDDPDISCLRVSGVVAQGDRGDEARDGASGVRLSLHRGVVLSFVVAAAALLALARWRPKPGLGFSIAVAGVHCALAICFSWMGLALSGATEFGASFMGHRSSLTPVGGLTGSFFTRRARRRRRQSVHRALHWEPLRLCVDAANGDFRSRYSRRWAWPRAAFLLVGFFPRLLHGCPNRELGWKRSSS